MAEKYYSVSPYAFCSNNPVTFAIKREQKELAHSAEREQMKALQGLNFVDWDGESYGDWETFLFALKSPIKAKNIGKVTSGSNNISTRSVRFATRGNVLNGSLKTDEDRGSSAGAMRHAIWQAAITAEYGFDVAKEVGDAHEQNPGADLSIRVFSDINLGDEVVDLLNNEIGRLI